MISICDVKKMVGCELIINLPRVLTWLTNIKSDLYFDFLQIVYTVFALIFFHLLARKPNLEKNSIYSNEFFDITYPNPVLFVPGSEQVGEREDCIHV